jgi:hypothetical protein
LMCLLLSAEGEIATCFLLEGGLYFLCMLRVRGFVAVWNIGFYTTVCCWISAMLECISDSGLTHHTVTNCLLHLNSDKAFAGFQHVCSINVTDVSQIFITSYFSCG